MDDSDPRSRGQSANSGQAESVRQPPSGADAEHRKYDLFTRTAPALIGSIADAAVATADTGFSAIFELTNSVLFNEGPHDAVPPEGLAVRWQAAIGKQPVVHNLLTISNFTQGFVDVSLDLAFASHFDDIFNVRGYLTDHPGKVLQPVVNRKDVELCYQGADGRLAEDPVGVLANSRPDHGGFAREGRRARRAGDSTRAASPDCVRDSGCRRRSWHSEPSIPITGRGAQAHAFDSWRSSAADWLRRDSSIAIDNMLFNRAIERCLLDLRKLEMELHDFTYFSSGLPGSVRSSGATA